MYIDTGIRRFIIRTGSREYRGGEVPPSAVSEQGTRRPGGVTQPGCEPEGPRELTVIRPSPRA